MLIGFSVGNYRSFKDIVTFSMVAASVPGEDKVLKQNNLFKINDNLSLLKSAAIYGANARGKSNLIKAIAFRRWFVLNSSKETQVRDKIDIERFRLSTETEKEPSFFEIMFILDERKYRYGFEVTEERVISEWLLYQTKTREFRMFERNLERDEFKPFNPFKKEGEILKDKTRNNALFLSVVAQFNGAISQEIITGFRGLNVISSLDDLGYRYYTLECFENNKHRDDIIQLIKQLDVGIDDLQIERTSLSEKSLPQEISEILGREVISRFRPMPTIKTSHWKYNSEGQKTSLEIFNIDDHESEGTQKLFDLSGPLIETLKSGEILFIDQLDARLHPIITRAILGLFNSKKINLHNAQLILTTHDTNLLSHKLFRRDQIWFTQKDQQSATNLYSLIEYKVKKDAAFEDDYIIGMYGAIPFIGTFKDY